MNTVEVWQQLPEPRHKAHTGLFTSTISEQISEQTPWEPAYFQDFFHFRVNMNPCMCVRACAWVLQMLGSRGNLGNTRVSGPSVLGNFPALAWKSRWSAVSDAMPCHAPMQGTPRRIANKGNAHPEKKLVTKFHIRQTQN